MNDIEYIKRYVERQKEKAAHWSPDIIPGNEYAALAYNDVLVFIRGMERAKEEREKK